MLILRPIQYASNKGQWIFTLWYFKVNALFISSAESHPAATVKIAPNELGDHQRSRAKRFNFGVPNVYEGKNLIKELLSERRLEAAIAEAEAAYKKASDAASYKMWEFSPFLLKK